ARYEFVNFTAAEVRDDLNAFLARLRGVNASARVVLTVSPQPPIATYEPRHVLVSSAFTKAALRVAADEVERAHANVWYFPGYELVAGGFNRGAYFASDLRTVTPEGVDHVMRLFLAHCAVAPDSPAAPNGALVANEKLADMETVCDEEAIAYGGDPAVRSGRFGAAPHPEYADYEWRDDFDIEVPVAAESPAEAAMEALAPASMRAPTRAVLPAGMHARKVITVTCTVRNDGDVALLSGGTHPVFLCYRWFDGTGRLTEIGRSIHTPLPGVLEPGAEITVPMRIEAPQHAGSYRLRVALLQSEVAWFDDVEPSNGIEASVEVGAKAVERCSDPVASPGECSTSC
ncbi:MAG TPA: GSCFA domain-containing protein, partial [Xanthomonadales bacterium]|nr:GSCFA domain-containing protein [Xanthomonadales bacterium]